MQMFGASFRHFLCNRLTIREKKIYLALRTIIHKNPHKIFQNLHISKKSSTFAPKLGA